MNDHGRFHMCMGLIFQFTSLKYGLGYIIQWRHEASWRLKSLPSNHRQPGCFGFTSLSMITPPPPKFRHNGLLRGESIARRWFPSQWASNVEGVSTPWRLMIAYKRHRYMWNNILLIRQIVCIRIPNNAIFWVVGLDQHGIYIDI